MSSTAATRAVNQVLAAVLSDRWQDKAKRRRIPPAALRAAAARGLAQALRTLARSSSPAERFTLSSWAIQIQTENSPRKATP